MAKTLEMNFNAEFGTTKISIKNPKDSLSPTEIKTAMEAMVQSNAFKTTKGDLIGVVDARVVERTTQDIELA